MARIDAEVISYCLRVFAFSLWPLFSGMPRAGTYHLARLLKGGRLDTDGVLDALRNAQPIESKQFAWTIIDTTDGEVADASGNQYPFLGGFLAKYDPEAVVEVVDADSRRVQLIPEPNLQRAASNFVYIPEFQAVAYRHVWNHIRVSEFRARFAEIIENFHRKFFVSCELEAIADLSRFISRIAAMEAVEELRATVTPPNPLFGPYWKDLKEYLERRRAQKLQIKEFSQKGEPLRSSIVQAARSVETISPGIGEPPDIGDAAILMAADGYGRADIVGVAGGTRIVARTSDNAYEFKMSTDATPLELAQETLRVLEQINTERRLGH